MRALGMLFVGRCASLPGVGLPFGVGVGEAVVELAFGVGVVVGGTDVGVGVPPRLLTITVTPGLASRLLDESNPLTESVCAPSGTEVESHRIDEGGDDAT